MKKIYIDSEKANYLARKKRFKGSPVQHVYTLVETILRDSVKRPVKHVRDKIMKLNETFRFDMSRCLDANMYYNFDKYIDNVIEIEDKSFMGQFYAVKNYVLMSKNGKIIYRYPFVQINYTPHVEIMMKSLLGEDAEKLFFDKIDSQAVARNYGKLEMSHGIHELMTRSEHEKLCV